MKAKINGIEVEGTPQEIMEYERLSKPIKTPNQKISPQEFVPFDPNWMERPATIIKTTATANTKGRCPNNGPCFCTGACKNNGIEGRYNYAFEQLTNGYKQAIEQESAVHKYFG